MPGSVNDAPRRWPVVLTSAHSTGDQVTLTIRTARERARISIVGVDHPPETAGDLGLPLLGRFALQQRRTAALLARVGADPMQRWHGRLEDLGRNLPPPGAEPGRLWVRPGRRAPLGEAPAGRGVVAFFSAGLDSFHVALREPGAVEALVYVHGFDVHVDDRDTEALVIEGVRAAATSLDLPLLEVRTDLRRWSDPRARWTVYANAGLEAVGMALCGRFREAWYGASVVDSALRSPVAPINAGNEWTEVIRRDGDRSRPQKLAAVIEHEAVRRHLRVCWQNTGAYNCGTCDKCVRTMVNAAAVGVLGDIETLPSVLDLDRVRALPVRWRSDRAFIAENLGAARRTGPGELVAVLEAKEREGAEIVARESS